MFFQQKNQKTKGKINKERRERKKEANNVPRWGNICSLQIQQRATSARLPTQRARLTQLHRLHNYTGNKMPSKAVADFFPSLLTQAFTRKHSAGGEADLSWNANRHCGHLVILVCLNRENITCCSTTPTQQVSLNDLSQVFAQLIFLFTAELLRYAAILIITPLALITAVITRWHRHLVVFSTSQMHPRHGTRLPWKDETKYCKLYFSEAEG